MELQTRHIVDGLEIDLFADNVESVTKYVPRRMLGSEMIKDRLYEPAQGDVLYHYCDSAAFRGIISSRSVWATAFYALNDPAERKWGFNAFVESTRRLEGILTKEFTEVVTAIVTRAHLHSMLMVCSLSLHADSDNQWRRYADNGQGFAVGFSANALRMPAKPLRILYEPERQIREIMGNLCHMHKVERELGFRYNDQFQGHCIHLGLDLCAYKDPTFRKEKEVRYAHIAGLVSSGGAVYIIPLGARGPEGQRLSEPCKTLFRARDGVEVPYVALDWTDKGKVAPLASVILGPGYPASERDVEDFLAAERLSGARVLRSRARLT